MPSVSYSSSDIVVGDRPVCAMSLIRSFLCLGLRDVCWSFAISPWRTRCRDGGRQSIDIETFPYQPRWITGVGPKIEQVQICPASQGIGRLIGTERADVRSCRGVHGGGEICCRMDICLRSSPLIMLVIIIGRRAN